MRIAIALESGKLAGHFGHSNQFILADVDPSTKQVLVRTLTAPPAHAPGVFPKWLAENSINVVIAGSVGTHARTLLAASGIQLLSGVPAAEPDALLDSFLNGTLQTAEGGCDHSRHACNH